MKIQGYDVGTEVKWNDTETGGFRTGIVRARFCNSDVTEINGQSIEVNVIGNSPTYAVEDASEQRTIVLRHTKVTMKQQNNHT